MVAVAAATVLYGQSESATRWSLASLGLGFAIFAIQSAILDSKSDDFEDIYQRARYSIQYIYSDSTRFVSVLVNKVECVFPIVVVSILPHAEFGPIDHHEHAPHFTFHRFQFQSKILENCFMEY